MTTLTTKLRNIPRFYNPPDPCCVERLLDILFKTLTLFKIHYLHTVQRSRQSLTSSSAPTGATLT